MNPDDEDLSVPEEAFTPPDCPPPDEPLTIDDDVVEDTTPELADEEVIPNVEDETPPAAESEAKDAPPEKKPKRARKKKEAEVTEPTVFPQPTPATGPAPAMTGMTKYEVMQTELSRMFAFFNEQLFNNEITPPVITIQAGKRGPKQLSWGWSTAQQVWHPNSASGTRYYEIALAADGMTRPPMDIMLSLLHEMVHLYNAQNQVQDCSRGNTYHNSFFKRTAEEHGMYCTVAEDNPKRGNEVITMTEETSQLVKDQLHPQVFVLARACEAVKVKEDKPKKEKKQSPFDSFKTLLKDAVDEEKKNGDGDIDEETVAAIAAKLSRQFVTILPPVEGTGSTHKLGTVATDLKQLLTHDDEDDVMPDSYMGDDDHPPVIRETASYDVNNQLPEQNSHGGDVIEALPFAYQCPSCHATFRAPLPIAAVCDPCQCPFEQTPAQLA